MLVQYILILLLILLKYRSISTPPQHFPYMSKFTFPIYLVVINLILVINPVIALKIGLDDAITTRSIAAQLHQEIEDAILTDIVSYRTEKLRQFLNSGGSPDRYFYAAINAGSIDCVQLMIARGANVNLPGEEGMTPLMTSARVTYRGTIEITELLIKKGANVNARANKGSTALMYASSGVAVHYEDDYLQVVRLLIK
jgi:hypothetical protein